MFLWRCRAKLKFHTNKSGHLKPETNPKLKTSSRGNSSASIPSKPSWQQQVRFWFWWYLPPRAGLHVAQRRDVRLTARPNFSAPPFPLRPPQSLRLCLRLRLSRIIKFCGLSSNKWHLGRFRDQNPGRKRQEDGGRVNFIFYFFQSGTKSLVRRWKGPAPPPPAPLNRPLRHSAEAQTVSQLLVK